MTVDVDGLGVSLGDPGYPDAAEHYESARDERYDAPDVTEDGGMGGEYAPGGATPDHPYGVNPRTGKPYKMSPEAREELGARLSAGRRAAVQNGRAPAKRARGSKGTGGGRGGSTRAQGPDYRMAVAGLLQLPMMALGVGARVMPSLGLDAAALALHTPAIADAVHHLAVDDARIASILDRVMQVGPYGALVAAVSPLLLQVLCNHGWVKPNATMGTMTPEELLDAIDPDSP